MEDILADFYGNFKWDCDKRKIKRYYDRIPNHLCRRLKIGIATELLARDNLNSYLKSKGLKKITHGVQPNSYIIKYHYGKNNYTKKQGVDIWFRYFNEKCESQEYYIEIMGWRKMSWGISNYQYGKRIKNRFETYDPKNKGNHVVFITKWNIPLIADRCKRDGIKMVAIPIQPSPSYLQFVTKTRYSQMSMESKYFLPDF